MKQSVLDIENKDFGSSLGGYSKKQVREYLNYLASQLEDLQRENQRLREDLLRKEKRIDDLQVAETELKRAVIAAERIGTEMKQNAKREAELVIKEAEHLKEDMIRDAESRLKEARFELSRLEKEYQLFREQFRGMLHAFERSLDTTLTTTSKGLAPKLDKIDSAS
jgi:cell division initiation protein